ncbi:hypothetical protein BsWGS_00830 [Bradybaena similaris]
MESQGINQTRAPSWGSPASRTTPRSGQPHNGIRQNFNHGGQSYCHGQSPAIHNYQRPSPYNREHKTRGANAGGAFQNGRQHNGSPGFQSPGQNFSPQNPFASQAPSFSSDNPYQSKGQTFSPNNPFSPNNTIQRNSQNNSPQFQRPQFQSSPLSQTPGMTNHSFSPRTPNTPFYTPSPRHSSHFRGNSDSSQRPFNKRNSSMGNPGGSSNIQDYISSSMLEDPWKNLPPKPRLQMH